MSSALNGSLRACRGLLTAVSAATRANRSCAVPAAQASFLAQIPNSHVLAADDLLSLCAILKEKNPIAVTPAPPITTKRVIPDLSEIQGQALPKRALEIAASANHHLLMIGPPGAGKTLLASALPGLLPPLNPDEQLELMLLQDLAGGNQDSPSDDQTKTAECQSLNNPGPARPFRAPHHTISSAGLIGGGSQPLPGEISLAHRGVLFLDETPEFPQKVLDLLRQPLEDGNITISRAKARCCFPASFQLVAAMNPCPCGNANSEMPCRCNKEVVSRYQNRISGPLLDRIDLYIPLERQQSQVLLQRRKEGDTSAIVRTRVKCARDQQLQRQGVLNAQLSGSALMNHCKLEPSVQRWYEGACDKLMLSARSIHRTMRVARTLADMSGEERVSEKELLEALGYRPRLGS